MLLMFKKTILLNSISSITQIFISATLLFVLYKFLYHHLGFEKLGLWSLVVSINSFFSVSGLGMQGSIVKFVSKYNTQKNYSKTSAIIQTSILSVFFLSTTGSLIFYPVCGMLLKAMLPAELSSYALKLLPIAFSSFIIGIIASVPVASLDGLNRIYVRNILSFIISVISFIFTLVLIPRYGLLGLSYIKFFESTLLLIMSILAVKKYLPVLPVIPIKWEKKIFNEIIGYSINFQVINFATIFFDPITKFLLTRYGGVAYVGMYEMANKLVLQIRQFIVAAYQSIIPVIASYKEIVPEKITAFYASSYKLLLLICVPVYSLLIISSPVISLLWIGHFDIVFIHLLSFLSGAWFINSVLVSAYFTNLGTGDVKDNVIGHLLMGSVNLIMGMILGYLYEGKGVIIASAGAIISSSLFQLISFHFKHNLRRILLPSELLPVSIICFLLVLLHYICFFVLIENVSMLVMLNRILLVTSFVVVAIVVLNNKMVSYILSYFMLKKNQLFNKRND